MLRFLQMPIAIVGFILLIGCSPIVASQVPALNQTALPTTPIAASESTLLLDRQTMAVRTILEKDARRLQIVAWRDEDELLLVDFDTQELILNVTQVAPGT